MSIANYSVVGRILSEVQASPVPPELGTPRSAEHAGQLLELRSTASAHEPPFATPFHFWAHALRDLLDRQGRPDLFEAMATHALCRAEEGARAGAALRELSQRVPGAPATGTEAFSASYCMIEQDVMASWVAESRSGFVAFFWLRGDWLAAAEPYDPEDAPAPGPGEEDAAEA